MKRVYGWKPDLPDHRDYLYNITGKRITILKTTNNRTTLVMPPVVDQGELGSCTGNGSAGVCNLLFLNGHVQNKAAVSPVPFSRLFAYYNARRIEGTVNEDSGAQIRDVIKGIVKYGICSEASLPYDISQFTLKPTFSDYREGKKFIAESYERLDNTDIYQLVDCLIKGYPFILGFSVYESFESATVAKTGIVPMPKKSEKLLGGHCVYCIDYDAEKKGFWCVNSWGENWGQKGLFFMPQAYLTNTNLADDFWTIKIIK